MMAYPLYSPRTLILILCNALALPFFLLLPKRKRGELLWSFRNWFEPLVIFLLLPASARETQTKPIWHQPMQYRRTGFIFGGNSEITDEFKENFQNIPLADGTRLNFQEDRVLLIPLIRQPSEDEYLVAIFDAITRSCEEEGLTLEKGAHNLYIVGHSLGGAIALQITERLLKLNPELTITLTIDRSFNHIFDVAIGLYGVFGHLLKATLGELWRFRSDLMIENLSHFDSISLLLIQTIPDSILGPGLLSKHWPEPCPSTWSKITIDIGRRNEYHAAMFRLLEKNIQAQKALKEWEENMKTKRDSSTHEK